MRFLNIFKRSRTRKNTVIFDLEQSKKNKKMKNKTTKR